MRTIAIALVASVLMISSIALSEIKTETIEYTVGDKTFRSFIAFDASKPGKRPGVLVVHEWWGLNDYAKRRARQLAEMGYVALAVDMFGDGKTTTDASVARQMAGEVYSDPEIAKARSEAALAALKARPEVDPDRTAAIGYCFGGAVVLGMARNGADLKGVVSFHGSLGTQTPAKPGTVKARVLVCHGADDPLVPEKQIADFMKEMRDAGVNWQMIFYGGAVHTFTNPEAGKAGIEGVAYNRDADVASWRAMKGFFDDIFGIDGHRH
jgi:dienelactone hydrolase